MTKKKKEPFHPLTILAVDPGLEFGACLMDRDRDVLKIKSCKVKTEEQFYQEIALLILEWEPQAVVTEAAFWNAKRANAGLSIAQKIGMVKAAAWQREIPVLPEVNAVDWKVGLGCRGNAGEEEYMEAVRLFANLTPRTEHEAAAIGIALAAWNNLEEED